MPECLTLIDDNTVVSVDEIDGVGVDASEAVSKMVAIDKTVAKSRYPVSNGDKNIVVQIVKILPMLIDLIEQKN